MSGYLHDAISLYLKDMVDWGSYFRYRKGDDVDAEAERAALRGVLETCAEICSQIEAEARAGWLDSPQLVDGQVIHAPNVKRGYELLADAGLVSLRTGGLA